MIDRHRGLAPRRADSGIDAALNNAFSQRQISTIYNQRNQYRVILEIDPRFQRDPSDIVAVYVPGADNTQIPLSSVARFDRGRSRRSW